MRRQSGFTLIEVLVAMLIILGAVIMVANAWSGNVARLEKARINNTTALLLQRKMAEVEIKYKEKSIDEILEEESGDFGAAYPAYQWTMESKEFEMPDLSDMLISRDGGAQSELLTIVRTMTEVFNKNIKEVTVSVLYTSKRTKKQVKNSITTYFIDYSKDISLGAAAAGGGGASQ